MWNSPPNNHKDQRPSLYPFNKFSPPLVQLQFYQNKRGERFLAIGFILRTSHNPICKSTNVMVLITSKLHGTIWFVQKLSCLALHSNCNNILGTKSNQASQVNSENFMKYLNKNVQNEQDYLHFDIFTCQKSICKRYIW
jgi:hypothetical protein